MSITTVSSREFNHDISKIKKASCSGPVFITDRGRPAHVLMSIDEYKKLTASQDSIIDLLAMPESDDIEFSPAKIEGNFYKSVDLS